MTKEIHVRLEHKDFKKLDKYCKENGKTKAGFIRALILKNI